MRCSLLVRGLGDSVRDEVSHSEDPITLKGEHDEVLRRGALRVRTEPVLGENDVRIGGRE